MPLFCIYYLNLICSDCREESSVYLVGAVRHLQISLRDKWRLPLILVRVSKNLQLQEADEKIWACFVHNKTQEELLVTIASALAARAPSSGSGGLPSTRSFPTRSGAATSCTLSGSTTPRDTHSHSPSSVSGSGCAGVPSTCTTVDVGTTSSVGTTGIEEGWASPQPLQRSPFKLGLPPLKPSPNSSTRSGLTGVDRTRGVPSQEAGPIPAPSSIPSNNTVPVAQQRRMQPQHHRGSSFDNLWHALGSRNVLSPVLSHSAPCSPQLTSRATIGASADTEGDAELGGMHGSVGNGNRRLSSRLSLVRLRQRETVKPIVPASAVLAPTAGTPGMPAVAAPRGGSSMLEWASTLLRRSSSSDTAMKASI